MGKFARTWQLMGASWRMLQQDKRLIVFPLISGVALAVVVTLFAVPAFVAFKGQAGPGSSVHWTMPMYAALFVFYFLDYFVIVFFNSALIACVLKQVDGEQPTLGYGLAFAWQRLPQILGWALLTSTVGMLLRMLEEKVGFVGRIVIGLLGMAWTVTSFLVVPVLVAEGTGPIESYRRSVEMLKRTWGEQIIGNVGIGAVMGLISFVVLLLGIPVVVLAAASGSLALVVGAVALVVVALLALSFIGGALGGIYRAALYRYAATGQIDAGFPPALVQGAFRPKKRSRLGF